MAQTTDPTPSPSGPADPSGSETDVPETDAPETDALETDALETDALETPTPMQGQPGTVISRRRTPKASPKRTRIVVRKVGPWSVFKLSLIFYFVVMLIGWGALLIVYGILGATGAIKSITDLLIKLSIWQSSPAQPTIHGKPLFTGLFVAGVVAVVIWSLINFFVALAYNLVSDVVGGLELTLAESKHRDDV